MTLSFMTNSGESVVLGESKHASRLAEIDPDARVENGLVGGVVSPIWL